MTPAPAVLLLDGPMAIYLLWVAVSVALTVVGGIWIFRPAVAAPAFKRVGVVWLVLTLALGLITWRVFSRNPVRASSGLQFTEAPNFSFRTVDGQSFSRDSLRGRVVLIDFWASWCGPCREALPKMFRLYNDFKTPRFLMIGVSEDEDQSKFEAFVAKEGMLWPEDWDPNGELAGRFSTDALPSYVVIDAEGHLRFLQKGYNEATYLRIREAISAALAAPDQSRLADAGR